MHSEYNVIVNSGSNKAITEDAYKALARALLNTLGKDICIELVKQYEKHQKT